MKKPDNPFLKKANGPKPLNRKQMKHGLGTGLGKLLGEAPAKTAATPDADIAAIKAAIAAKPAAAGTAAAAPVAAVAPAAPSAAPVDPSRVVIDVPPLDIERSPWQPRTEFDETALNELAESIKSSGLIQPVTCRRRKDGKLELICGERRLRASVVAGLKKIPVVVKDVDDATAATMTVTENSQREDLNPIDEAEGYKLLQDSFNLTQADIAERVGKSRPVIANATRLLELPDEVRELVRRRTISTGHAKVLLGVEGEKDRILLARDCVNEALTVRALERKIQKMHEPVVEKKTGTPDLPESYVRNLQDEMRKLLGCAVRVPSGVTHANGKHTKGVLEIDFLDNDDLDRVLAMIGVKLD
ncbi:MAG: ParB/RepB/Spo0J family partition protein [Kiritimatiellae bacterium]|nr:ParB/RepB/Spo0J family partition protein [Kiritimatiellia bacterium]